MEDQSKSKANVVYMVDPNSRQSRKYKKLHLKQKHKQLSQIKPSTTIFTSSVYLALSKKYSKINTHHWQYTLIMTQPYSYHHPSFVDITRVFLFWTFRLNGISQIMSFTSSCRMF